MLTEHRYQATGQPPMIGQRLTLNEWLAYIATVPFGPVPPSRVVLHHTYVPTEAQWAGLRSMQGMQRFYRSKGWSSAPHIYAAPDGIWLFTPLDRVGIHAGVGNSGYLHGQFWYSIGLETVGDFDRAKPTGPTWDHAKAVLGSFSRRLGIAPRQLISFHRDYTTEKSCPGNAVSKPWVYAEVDTWLRANPGPETVWMQVNNPLTNDPRDNTLAIRTRPNNEPWNAPQAGLLLPGQRVQVQFAPHYDEGFAWLAGPGDLRGKGFIQTKYCTRITPTFWTHVRQAVFGG